MNFRPVVDSLTKILTDILNFIPLFINGLIILIIGYLVCLVVQVILRFVFRQIRLEQLADRIGVTRALRGLGIRAPLPEMLTQIVFFFLLLSFAREAVRLMGLAAVAVLLDNVLLFIPRAISAALLLIFGSMLGRFLGDTVTTVAENVNITYSRALGKIIEYAIVAFVVVLAISTLGVDTTILTSSFTIIIAAAGLAIALTFALGSRESARNIIAGFYVRQNFRTGERLTLGEYSGRIRSTSGAYTVLEVTGEGSENSTISLPNSLLLQSAVIGQENAANTGAETEVPGQENTATEGNGQPEGPGS
jgi:small-conductance mechanosensitive channel